MPSSSLGRRDFILHPSTFNLAPKSVDRFYQLLESNVEIGINELFDEVKMRRKKDEGRMLYAGVDVGRNNDRTVVTVVERIGNTYRALAILRLSEMRPVPRPRIAGTTGALKTKAQKPDCGPERDHAIIARSLQCRVQRMDFPTEQCAGERREAERGSSRPNRARGEALARLRRCFLIAFQSQCIIIRSIRRAVNESWT